MASVVGAGKASLGGTSGHRLSICSLVCPWWCVAFPWAGLSRSLGTAGKGQMRSWCPGAGRLNHTWQRSCLEPDLISLPSDLGDVTKRVGDVDRGLWCGQAWLWGPGQIGDLRQPAQRLGPLGVWGWTHTRVSLQSFPTAVPPVWMSLWWSQATLP